MERSRRGSAAHVAGDALTGCVNTLSGRGNAGVARQSNHPAHNMGLGVPYVNLRYQRPRPR
jgi:hypothetical protein